MSIAKPTRACASLPAPSRATTTSSCAPSLLTGVPLTKGAPSSLASTVAGPLLSTRHVGCSGSRDTWPSVTPSMVTLGGLASSTTARHTRATLAHRSRASAISALGPSTSGTCAV